MTEPLPRHFDYQGFERLSGYVRGVTHVRCAECKTTGRPKDSDPTQWTNMGPWCSCCGGYGCVPKATTASAAQDAAVEPLHAP